MGFWDFFWLLIWSCFFVAYLVMIARGRETAERQAGAAQQAQVETDRYIQYVASNLSSADQIASAKALRDDGTITQAEYECLTPKSLA